MSDCGAGPHQMQYHERKSEQYVRQAREAEARIKTLPQWMQNNLKPPTETIYTKRDMDLAWAAGFFDGEGCIYLQKIKNHHGTELHELRIEVSQVDPAPINRFKTLFEGWVGFQEIKLGNKRRQNKWKLSSAKAEKVLIELLPYLTVKKEQAELALEFRKTVERNRLLTSEIIEQREKIYLALKAAKIQVYGDL